MNMFYMFHGLMLVHLLAASTFGIRHNKTNYSKQSTNLIKDECFTPISLDKFLVHQIQYTTRRSDNQVHCKNTCFSYRLTSEAPSLEKNHNVAIIANYSARLQHTPSKIRDTMCLFTLSGSYM